MEAYVVELIFNLEYQIELVSLLWFKNACFWLQVDKVIHPRKTRLNCYEIYSHQLPHFKTLQVFLKGNKWNASPVVTYKSPLSHFLCFFISMISQ